MSWFLQGRLTVAEIALWSRLFAFVGPSGTTIGLDGLRKWWAKLASEPAFKTALALIAGADVSTVVSDNYVLLGRVFAWLGPVFACKPNTGCHGSAGSAVVCDVDVCVCGNARLHVRVQFTSSYTFRSYPHVTLHLLAAAPCCSFLSTF